MLILLANDRNGLRLAQNGPTAHRAARRDDPGSQRSARRSAQDGEALVQAA
jgi:hypothetical protein